MTDAEALRHLWSVRMFCTAQQALAVDRAMTLLQRQISKEKNIPPES